MNSKCHRIREMMLVNKSICETFPKLLYYMSARKCVSA